MTALDIHEDASKALSFKDELNAEVGSFLLELRCNLVWDKAAFARLIRTMQDYVEQTGTSETVERWTAEGFWYLDHFVQDWSSHPSFPRTHEQHYYDAAYRRLHDLAYWLFVGESPYNDGTLPPFSA